MCVEVSALLMSCSIHKKYFSSSVTRATDCVSASQEEEELLLGHGDTVAVETGTCIYIIMAERDRLCWFVCDRVSLPVCVRVWRL